MAMAGIWIGRMAASGGGDGMEGGGVGWGGARDTLIQALGLSLTHTRTHAGALLAGREVS